MTGAADGIARPRKRASTRAKRAKPPKPVGRLRLAASVLLIAVSLAAMLAGVALLVVRRELRARDDDTRPCPGCRSAAILNGRSLTDEQGTRLLFATPEDAARYAADYAKAMSAGR